MGKHPFVSSALILSVAPFLCSGCGSSSETGQDGGADASTLGKGDGSASSDARHVDASHQGDSDSGAPHDGGSAPDALPSGRSFPDTTSSISVLADQLPSMSSPQMSFAASHYVGTQKQLLPVTKALRALNPKFLVLHYHLAMWQSAVDFILNGVSWGNDLPTVSTHDDWFWQNASGMRVPSSADGKFLMNVSNSGFESYWASSLEAQVKDGDYDAIFFDSASPALLQGECSGADPRLAGTAARDTSFAELGGATWIDAWQTWISALSSALMAKGIPLIPNTSAFVTGWDNTNYTLTPGIFSEGYASTGFVESDWQASTNELLLLASEDKIMILQNYLSDPSDVATRLYYLGNYLLVKGKHTYLDYFASGPLEWYPEWTVDLGAPTTASTTDVSKLASAGVYRRDFAKGFVLVNPSGSSVTVPLGATKNLVTPSGGGAVDTSGDEPGTVSTSPVTSVVLAATSAAILLD
jgi:Hypothetical glycosyl hydrolase family 15